MNTAFIWDKYPGFLLLLSIDFLRAVFCEKAIFAKWPPNTEGQKILENEGTSPACWSKSLIGNLYTEVQFWVAAA